MLGILTPTVVLAHAAVAKLGDSTDYLPWSSPRRLHYSVFWQPAVNLTAARVAYLPLAGASQLPNHCPLTASV